MRRHDLINKKTLTKTKTMTKMMTKTFSQHPKRTILKTSDLFQIFDLSDEEIWSDQQKEDSQSLQCFQKSKILEAESRDT